MASGKRNKSRSSKKKPKRGKRPEPTADEIIQTEKMKESIEAAKVRAAILSGDIPEGAIGIDELQRQLGEQTSRNGVLVTRLRYAKQEIERLEQELAIATQGKDEEDDETGNT